MLIAVLELETDEVMLEPAAHTSVVADILVNDDITSESVVLQTLIALATQPGLPNLAIQLSSNGWDWGAVNYSDVGVSAAAGAASVFAAARVATIVAGEGLTGVAALTANAGGNAVQGSLITAGAVATGAAINEADGDGSDVGAGELGDALKLGAGAGLAGTLISPTIQKGLAQMSTKLVSKNGKINGVNKVITEAAVDTVVNSDVNNEIFMD